MTESTPPTKDIPIYAGEEGDTSQLVGWASKEADGVYATDFLSDFTGDVNNIWYGEPDPNAPVVEIPEPDPDADPVAEEELAKKRK